MDAASTRRPGWLWTSVPGRHRPAGGAQHREGTCLRARPATGGGRVAGEAWLAAEPDAPAALARAGAREAWLLTRGAEVPIVVDRDALAQPLVGGIVPASWRRRSASRGRFHHRGAVGVARLAVPRLAMAPDDLVTLEPAYLRAPRGLEGGAPPASR